MRFAGVPSYWFAPDIGDNLSLPDGEQLRVEVIRPTAEDFGQLSSVRVVRTEDGRTEMKSDFDTRAILRRHIGGVQNLEVVSAGKDGAEKITTGEALARARFRGSGTLVSLICAEVMRERLSDEEKKITGQALT